jgi:hypothetical protein
MSTYYEIQIRGHVDLRWFAWCEELSVAHTDDGYTLLFGSLSDQAALHGVLTQIRDVALPLISVRGTELIDGTSGPIEGQENEVHKR